MYHFSTHISLVYLVFYICLIDSLLLPSSAIAQQPGLMLAKIYSQQLHSIEIRHYWVSEKYDGVRAYWNGEQLLSRQGNPYQAPTWFLKGLPDFPLDGELWLGRQQFDRLSGIVRKKVAIDKEWEKVRFMVFDLPESRDIFTLRLQQLRQYADFPPWVRLVPQWRVADEQELMVQLADYTAAKAEGLMLHDGRSYYSNKRSNDLLKLKTTFDAEATVLSYVEGKGKYQKQLGAIWVKANIINDQGHTVQQVFKIGTGFTDQERLKPPPIGSEISFKYTGLTSKGKPRFPRYWRPKLRLESVETKN